MPPRARKTAAAPNLTVVGGTAKKPPAKKAAAKKATAPKKTTTAKKAPAATPPAAPPQTTSAPKTVTEAATSNDRKALLVALRDRIAKSVENPTTPARDLAPLSRQLQAIAKELEALDAAENEGDGIGEAASTPDAQFDAEAL